jgi:biotin carboxyl carrier protein
MLRAVRSINLANISCQRLAKPLQNAPRALFASYPEHEVVGLPALSPTMQAGTLAKWNVQEGDSFQAGEVIADVETDKATMGFEAQDPGVVAKILVPAGSEVKVGTPIMIIVDEADSVTNNCHTFLRLITVLFIIFNLIF